MREKEISPSDGLPSQMFGSCLDLLCCIGAHQTMQEQGCTSLAKRASRTERLRQFERVCLHFASRGMLLGAANLSDSMARARRNRAPWCSVCCQRRPFAHPMLSPRSRPAILLRCELCSDHLADVFDAGSPGLSGC